MQTKSRSLKKLSSISRFLKLSGKYYFQNYNLKLFYDFVQNDSEIGAIIQRLLLKYPQYQIEAETVINNPSQNIQGYRGEGKIPSFEAWVAFCLFYVQAATKSNAGSKVLEKFVGRRTTGDNISEEQKIATQFFNDCIEPILIYIELQIQQTQNTLYILQRYKILCEWYDRKKLFKAKEPDITRNHLNRYLFDQGFTYSLSETMVPSGKIDNFALDIGFKDKHELANLPDAIIIEGKIYNGSKNAIQKVRNQVNKRMEDLDFQEGFCIIFNKTQRQINLSVSETGGLIGGYTQGFYYIKEATKTTFFLVTNLDKSFVNSTTTNKEVKIELI
ncbi:MAG TPA: hypothetical protein VMW29_01475 [Candidatus Bathyarchaeia archaeon]|nr:hypothetical protein [Candidatus Bathyarchaeia archaeon]